MANTIEFHNTPALTREYVNNWLIRAKKQNGVEPGQLAVLEDVLKLIDVAIRVLQPEPTASETKKS
jgi:hypothetical protein